MNNIIWSEDGWTVSVIKELEDGYVIYRYRVQIAHDWFQPWENYTYLGGEAHLKES